MIRRLALTALLVALSACGARGERDAFTDSRIPPGLGPAWWPPQGWAWGLIQVAGAPAQRYGVAAPMDQPPIAQALMLPGYGGTAEEDFRAAGALIDQRVQVWALDGVGQGGSGRIALPRDLGHLDSFAADVEGVRQTIAQLIRPQPDTPLVAIADGTAAPVLLRVLQLAPPGVAAVVLTEPRLPASGRPAPRIKPPMAGLLARGLGYGRVRAPGAGAWRREGDGGTPGSLAFVRHAWQTANPDLRMGGPSLGWLGAFDDLAAQVRSAGWRKANLPVLMLVDPARPLSERRQAAGLCSALPHCTLTLAGQAAWPANEAAFITGVAGAAALPLPGHGR